MKFKSIFLFGILIFIIKLKSIKAAEIAKCDFRDQIDITDFLFADPKTDNPIPFYDFEDETEEVKITEENLEEIPAENPEEQQDFVDEFLGYMDEVFKQIETILGFVWQFLLGFRWQGHEESNFEENSEENFVWSDEKM